VVMDNYTFQHGNKGYEMAGKWMVVKRNVRTGSWLKAYNHCYQCGSDVTSDNIYGLRTDVNFIGGQYRGWFNSLKGGTDCKYTDDNMSRAMDATGWNTWFDSNYWDQTGSNPGVDGEGILFQRQGCVEVFSVAQTNNKQGPCFGSGGGYIHPYDVHIMGMLQGWNDGTKIGNYCKPGDKQEDFSMIGNTNVLGVVDPVSKCAADVIDTITWCNGATPATPSALTVLHNSSEKFNLVSWTDNASNEVAFKIEKRVVGTTDWTTVAFRPVNMTGGISGTDPVSGNSNPAGWVYPGLDINSTPRSAVCGTENVDLNPQQWRDYFLVPGKVYEYRVIAMGCTQTDLTAATNPQVQVNVQYMESIKDGLLLFPIPASELFNIRMENPVRGKINIAIMDMQGKIVKSMPFYKTADVLNVIYPISDLKTGVYFVTFTGNGYYTSHRVVKQ